MTNLIQLDKSRNQRIDFGNHARVELYLKREDQIHPHISGNKYRKLKYNLIEARKQGFESLLSFGGAFSNHIAALAAVGKEMGFSTIGVIRGEELKDKIPENPTLELAQKFGMQLRFVSRKEYGNKMAEAFISKLRNEFGAFYLIPEGGTNALAVAGCEEILTDEDASFQYICCPVGTGGTISGLINSAEKHQKVLGFPALKGDFLNTEIRKFVQSLKWELISDYHFGGYAKINKELIAFMNQFKATHTIALDPVYTGKMMYGINDLIEKGYFPEGSKVLAVHTGGLQGISGMNRVLKKKNLPLID